MRIVAIVVLTFSLYGCDAVEDFWGAADCDDEQDSDIQARGQPDDVDTYFSDGWSSEIYLWRTQGVRITYSWGDSLDNCQRSTYTFTPF